MNDNAVKRLGLILSVQAEIEAMKAENIIRKERGCTLAYDERAFYEKSEELKELCYKHDEQL